MAKLARYLISLIITWGFILFQNPNTFKRLNTHIRSEIGPVFLITRLKYSSLIDAHYYGVYIILATLPVVN